MKAKIITKFGVDSLEIEGVETTLIIPSAVAEYFNSQNKQIAELKLAQLVRCPECGFKTIKQAIK